MNTILKRTTAIAALAALPLAPIAAQAQSQGEQSQSQYGVQSKSETVPSDRDIKIYKSQEDKAPAKADVTKRDGEYIERSTQNAAENDSQADDDTGASTADNTTQNALKGKPDQAAASDTQTGQPAVNTQTSDAFEGKNVKPGVEPGEPPAQEQTQAGAGQEADLLVAKVGDSEIHRSDVLGVIGMLPPQLQQQPPEMLIPMALDQLVLRELILQEAQKEGLENDPEVTGMATDASDQAREDAMVQVWLDRQLADAVTEAKVNETYGTIQGQLGPQAPELEQIRPQIEQELRRQAFNEISTDLQADADVTIYGPDGQPVAQ